VLSPLCRIAEVIRWRSPLAQFAYGSSASIAARMSPLRQIGMKTIVRFNSGTRAGPMGNIACRALNFPVSGACDGLLVWPTTRSGGKGMKMKKPKTIAKRLATVIFSILVSILVCIFVIGLYKVATLFWPEYCDSHPGCAVERQRIWDMGDELGRAWHNFVRNLP
jgi:hypothetical protein